ncbi:MAG TPA: energy-coupling factor transporter transmembrane component T [bacterium]|nr:energy-coupling factor transporter transmembrane component T [bacterium]
MAIALYPVSPPGGILYFAGLASSALLQRKVRRFVRTRLLPMVPAILLFGMIPYVISLFQTDPVSRHAELIFGLAIIGKTFAILLAVSFFTRNVPVSHFLRALRDIKIPLRVIFLLMIAYRFISVFFDEVRLLLEARSLRLFGRSQLHRIRSTFGVILRKAFDYSESIYVAMRLRGGESTIPLLARCRKSRSDGLLFGSGILLCLLPYCILLL